MMITKDGVVKILDFGLAKLKGQIGLTKAGVTLGTAAYMSPEQARGEQLDHRTDIWSLGVLLYEMLMGQLPFKGEYEQAVIYSILNEEPEPLTALRTDLPTELDRIVNKAIAKNPLQRYQQMGDFQADLKSLQTRLEAAKAKAKPTEPKFYKRKLFYFVGGLIALIAALILAKIVWFKAPQEAIDSIAVLPFVNLSADPEQEYFSDGMTEALITELSTIKALRVISRTSIMHYKKTDKKLPEIARELHVKAVVEGSVQRVQDMVRINAQLVRAEPEEHLWAKPFTKSLANILELQSEVALAIANEIKIVVTPEEKRQLASSRPVNPEAHEAYLKGRYYVCKFTPEAAKKGLEYYEQAIEKDPNYAPAYAELAVTYFWLGQPLGALNPQREAFSKSKAAAIKAVELDDKLAEAHAALAIATLFYDWDWESAERGYKRALELNPNSADAHREYAIYLGMIGRHRESIAEVQRALDLDPFNLAVRALVGELFWYGREYDRAIEQLQKTLELDPNFARVHLVLWGVYEAKGMYSEAVATWQKYLSLTGVSPEEVAAVGNAYATGGMRGVYRWWLERSKEKSKQGYVRPIYFAWDYAALGEKDQAFAWLEKAYQERSSGLLFLKVDPSFDNLRSDPRFTALLKKVGLEK
ncbi:tetratricopeptide repeat protein [bacterium]|nr:tetratricopeptide repeat protein [bacterium]